MTRSQNDPLVVPYVPVADTIVCPNDDPLDLFMFKPSGALKAKCVMGCVSTADNDTGDQMQRVLKTT